MSEKAPQATFSNELEKAEGLRAIAHQDVLGLLVMIQHHLVRFRADAGLLVAAECRMRRIRVKAVRPNPSGLDAAAEAIGHVEVAGPYAGTEAVQRVVGDLERLSRCIEGRHRNHGSEDLLLETAHLAVP